MTQRTWLFWFFLIFLRSVGAREGVVTTRTGQSYEGFVRVVPHAVIVSNPNANLLIEIPATNLEDIVFSGSGEGESSFFPVQLGANGLPVPWESADIGSTEIAGQAVWHAGIWRISSAGTNIDAESDAFHFLYKPVVGNSEIVAHLTSLEGRATRAHAGLMMRAGLEADAAHVTLALSSAREAVFRWRGEAGGERPDTRTRGRQMGDWIRLRREGDSFTGSRSWNGLQWIEVHRELIPMREALFVGLAVCSGHPRYRVSASFVDFDEGPSLPLTRFTPQVELWSGSLLLAANLRLDDDGVHLGRGLDAITVSVASLANVRFQPMSAPLLQRIRAGEPGVLLLNHDFLEGECRRIDAGRVTVRSVLLGVQSFDVHHDVAALVFRKSRPPQTQYEIKGVEGSAWVGSRLELDQNEVVLQEPALGRRRFSLPAVAELRRRP